MGHSATAQIDDVRAWTRQRELWAHHFALLRQKMVHLERLEMDLIKVASKLTRDDIAETASALKLRTQIARGLGKAQSAMRAGETYTHLLASMDRFKEETERAIRLLERLLQRHRDDGGEVDASG